MSEDQRNDVEGDVAEGTREAEGTFQGGPDGGEEVEGRGLESRVHELADELEGLNDRHLRLVAEFENYRRRVQAELRESSERAQAALVGQLLDALDDLERVGYVETESREAADLLEGVEMAVRKLNRILEDAGAEMVDPQGKEFSPATMEAVMKVPADSPDEDDRVHEVFQKGCVFKGHLVRPARVSVQKHD